MSKNTSIKPNINIFAMRARILTYHKIRQFFIKRNVFEVDIPLLSAYPSTTYKVDNFIIKNSEQICYLHNGDNAELKHLVVNGYPDMYQITKAFREDNIDNYHQPEFTLLKWLRINHDITQIMSEITLLLKTLSNNFKNLDIEYIEYQHVFDTFGINPFTDSINTISELTKKLAANATTKSFVEKFNHEIAYLDANFSHDKNAWLAWLFYYYVEQNLGNNQLTFLTDFPLPTDKNTNDFCTKIGVDSSDNAVEKRFDMYYQGVKIASGKEEFPVAETPKFKGFSTADIGIDRLLMFMLNKKSLNDVILFPFEN